MVNMLYCSRDRKMTENQPKSEIYKRTKNGRFIVRCLCACCGTRKVGFVSDGDVPFGIREILTKARAVARALARSFLKNNTRLMN